MTDQSILGITFRGHAGQLMVGSRPAAAFLEWEADSLPGPRRLRVTAKSPQFSQVYWDPSQTYTAALQFGKAVICGKASVEQVEPLVLIVEEC